MQYLPEAVECLFIDMNAFFASVEQQQRPELRGRPVAVAPTRTDRTCCIAVSYEARAFGVCTGLNVGRARRRCPGLTVVEGRHERYVAFHHQILSAVESVLPIDRVCSIDEMACRLAPADRSPPRAKAVAWKVKRAVAERVGEQLRCSIGLAPNRFLAKVASNLDKPDGLTLITPGDLPQRLYPLRLTDLPGVGPRMQRRLAARGVTTTRQLCALSKPSLREVWGSIVGEQWWAQLRGREPAVAPTTRKTLGHSHVLAPAVRTRDGARAVLVRLLHKAAARLRKERYCARHLEAAVRLGGDPAGWRRRLPVGRTDDTPTLLRALTAAWDADPPIGTPLQAAVTLLGLQPRGCVSLPLFEEDRRARRAAETMDGVNRRLGPNAVYFASMHESRGSAPVRIAFSRIPDLETETGG